MLIVPNSFVLVGRNFWRFVENLNGITDGHNNDQDNNFENNFFHFDTFKQTVLFSFKQDRK